MSDLLIHADKPVVMAFSDHDPSGAAGIQADVETLFSMGCHCTSIATALTAQDTFEHKDSFATAPSVLIEQARAILEDMPVTAFKVGQVCSHENIEAIYTILRDYPHAPVVLEPSLGPLTGVHTEQVTAACRSLLVPLARIVSLDAQEAVCLAPQGDSVTASIHELMDAGSEYVLLTGAAADAGAVTNHLYDENGLLESWDWPRLPHTYIGTGSTLAASLAAHIAHGFDIVTAAAKAQDFTWHAMKNARRIGLGQYIPNRLYWHT